MKRFLAVNAGAVSIVSVESLGGELVVSPEGMAPHEALRAIRAAKAGGDRGAWIIRS